MTSSTERSRRHRAAVRAKQAVVAQAATPATPPPLSTLDRLTGLVELLAGQVDRALRDDDTVMVSTLSRTLNQALAQLARASPVAEDSDVVRVKRADIAASADRAMLALQTLADAVIRERAAWPRCECCGQPKGKFADADKSVLRSLMERVAMGGE